jgi:hypothetical protein
MSPPFHLIHLIEVDVDFLAGRGGGGFQRPGGFINADSVGEITLRAETNQLVLMRA